MDYKGSDSKPITGDLAMVSGQPERLLDSGFWTRQPFSVNNIKFNTGVCDGITNNTVCFISTVHK